MRSLLALLACFAAVFAQPAQAANRFLFIVDTSSAMKPLDNVARETVFDFIYSGLHGHMTNGDTYGLWLVNNENDTSFAMETWRPKHNVELGARASVHVKEHGFKGRARLDLALADALRVVKRVHDLTIVIVSNGETPLTGTAFDEEINARYGEMAPVMKKAKKTVNTVLAAQDGAVAAWTVNTPEDLIKVPYLPPKPKPVEIAQTNDVASSSNLISAAAVSAKVEPPKPRIASNPIIITKETVAQEKRNFQALAMTGTTNETPVAHAAPQTNPPIVQVAAPETNAAPAAVTNKEVSSIAVATTNVPASNAEIVETVTNRAETNAAVVAITEPPSAAVATQPASPAPARIAALPAAGSSNSIHPAAWFALGAGAASLGVLAMAFVFRSRRREPSLISEAMARQRIGSIVS